MIEGRSADVRQAAARLACSTCVLVDLGINRADLSDAHMIYFYDEDICFTRLGFPHMLAASNAPPGTGSIQAEVYFSDKYKPFTARRTTASNRSSRISNAAAFFAKTTRSFPKSSMLREYANIIFDLERADALKIVHGYLDDIGIAYCGRFGDWGYIGRTSHSSAAKMLHRK